ncbi:hypothetical protein [Runella limosa]|uniref:hypothetical protein n=1 Tax=Runella limosa TaxID=370978 RepID=UPI0004185A57|nr:hypothetical protein [Runella limosa]
MAKIDIKAAISQKTQQSLNNSYISSEQIKQSIVVLEELRSFIPSPTNEELTQLEANIVKNGCKDALLLWETTQRVIDKSSLTPDAPVYILVDGHNRFKICRERGVNFNVQVMRFESLKEVKDYMIDLQLGRRNLTPQQASYFRGLRYNIEKAEKGKYDRKDHKSHFETYGKMADENDKSQNDTYIQSVDIEGSTSEKLAQEYKVSRATIMRDAEFAAGLDQLQPTLKQAVLNGEIKIGKTDIQKLAKRKVKDLVDNIEELENVLSGDEEPKVIDKSRNAVQKQLTATMTKILKASKISVKDLERLIEVATELKKIL